MITRARRFPFARFPVAILILRRAFIPAFTILLIIADHLRIARQFGVNYRRVFHGLFFSRCGRSFPFLRAFARRAGVGGGGERRAVVWPVSWLVRGRAWPGGLTLAGEAGPLAGRPWWVRPGLPALHGEGPAPGRWVKNRTARHQAPGPCGGHRAGRPASCGGPAGIPMFPRSNTRHQMHRVPVSARNVMIVPRLTAARPCRAAAVRRLSSLPQAAVMNQ